MKKIKYKLRNEVTKAPISGIIFDVKPDNDSYITNKTEKMMSIIPGGSLKGKVNIGNRDIGFIRKGQDVRVRVDSFPFTEYGELDGRIEDVGADALPPDKMINQYHFPVMINLKDSELKTKEGIRIPLQSGMTITANLKLRDRRLIELMSDLFASKGDSLKRLRQP